MNEKAVILLSGGIDSSTTLALVKSEGYKLYALSFDYNQRHRIELESARKVASALGVEKHLIIKFDLREIGGSALLNNNREIGGHGDAEKITDSPCHRVTVSQIPHTYVPARNTIFLSFALAWAEVLEVEDIFGGANVVDYSGYPDCRPEYLRAFEDMANLATKASVEGKMRFKIHAPLINMTKAEIIKKGARLGLDYSLTWSCYDPQEGIGRIRPIRPISPIPCGKCDSCLFRAKGFKEAGIKDPLLN